MLRSSFMGNLSTKTFRKTVIFETESKKKLSLFEMNTNSCAQSAHWLKQTLKEGFKFPYYAM